ncbi:gamma-glutamyl-gamma-aminobutyrate hydrolase family protein [Garciella nitratireducens]|uniref:gamma-glutamyl-gamma-aminobutyrate hydrolase family protein n=1 Tax=Garciella nitratireducens TaxID=218205 RepID=UPI000DEA8AF2|nr:gamma-glutamyl-gamma-aminobutyrate hydrolase family protein [Garciella nitratireducens]RBP44167.1 putative glutamine amidotransferase [Garciella nitratireducens]
MKPLIGLTCSIGLKENYQYKETNYCEAVRGAGGIPILIPSFSEFAKDIPQLVRNLDGIIVSGGNDIYPMHYGEGPIQALGSVHRERDEVELEIVKECIKNKKPFFGICRGLQVLNVALGGDLYQDIYSQIKGKELEQHNHSKGTPPSNHSIEIKNDTFLYDIYKQKIGWVNSSHHQAIKKVAPSLEPIAWSKDGFVEAVVHKEIPSIFAVQWHPEKMYHKDHFSQQIFDYFIDLMR